MEIKPNVKYPDQTEAAMIHSVDSARLEMPVDPQAYRSLA
jgi:hypothetical protein